MTEAPPATAALPFLDQLLPATRERLLEHSEQRRLATGETLIRAGELLEGLYIVHAGLLGVQVPDRSGKATEIARHGPGDLCGEMSFLLGERAAAHVAALTASEVWYIPHAVLRAATKDDASIMQALGSCVAARLSAANRRLLEEGAGFGVAVTGTLRSAWALQLLARATERAARLIGRPGLLIDLDEPGAPGAWPGYVPTPTLAQIEAGAGFPDPVPMTDGALTLVIRGEGDSLDLAWLARSVAEWRERYGVVVARAGDPALLESRLFADLSGPLLLLEEGVGGAVAAFHDLPAVFLRRAPQAGTPGECSALGRARGSPVLHVAPGGPAALAGLQDADREPAQQAVDWLARHLIERKVGVALGAGGSKGYAHIGVVRELFRLGVPIDYVAGCSIGAPIAAGVAVGMELDLLRRKLDDISKKAMRPTIPTHAFLSDSRLHKEIAALAQGKQFEELELPLALVAVDMQRHQEVVLQQGDLAEAIFASFAIPGFYPPFEIEGRALVDGALLNPIPIGTVAALGADVVIGVKLTNPVEGGPTRSRRRRLFRAPPIVDTISRAFEVMQWKIAADLTVQADILIEPRFEGPTGLRDFHRGDDFEEVGRRAILESRDQIEALLPWIGAAS